MFTFTIELSTASWAKYERHAVRQLDVQQTHQNRVVILPPIVVGQASCEFVMGCPVMFRTTCCLFFVVSFNRLANSCEIQNRVQELPHCNLIISLRFNIIRKRSASSSNLTKKIHAQVANPKIFGTEVR